MSIIELENRDICRGRVRPNYMIWIIALQNFIVEFKVLYSYLLTNLQSINSSTLPGFKNQSEVKA